jgi:hypothetical protein
MITIMQIVKTGWERDFWKATRPAEWSDREDAAGYGAATMTTVDGRRETRAARIDPETGRVLTGVGMDRRPGAAPDDSDRLPSIASTRKTPHDKTPGVLLRFPQPL